VAALIVITSIVFSLQYAQAARDIQKDFEKGSHHVNASWESMTPEVCARCHDEGKSDGSVNTGSHKNGSVDLKVYDLFPSVTGVVSYTAGSTPEYDVNEFCLGCHNDLNSTIQPFISVGDAGTPGMFDVPSGGTDAGSVEARYADTAYTVANKYSPNVYNVVPQLQKSYSPHGNPAANERGLAYDTVWADDGGRVTVACLDCHNSHGSDAGGGTLPMTTYSSTVGGTSAGIIKEAATYSPMENLSGIAVYSAASDLCFDCHLGDDPAAPKTYGNYSCTGPVMGYYDAGRWGGDDLWQSSFSYKTALSSGNGYGGQKGGHFGASMAMANTPTGQVNGLCASCHDPHGIAANAPSSYRAYMVPALKGTWMVSPYKEDRAANNDSAFQDPNVYARDWWSDFATKNYMQPVRANPRYDFNNPPKVGAGFGTGRPGSNWGLGGTGHDGYYIDDNTFGTNYTHDSNGDGVITDATNLTKATDAFANHILEPDTLFAGLCTGCHPRADLMSVSFSNGYDTIYIHNTVKGWYETDGAVGADLFKTYHANQHLMSYDGEHAPAGRHRCNYESELRGTRDMPMGYRWSVAPGNTTLISTAPTSSPPPQTSGQTIPGYIQAAFHQFPCSKCHAAHTSKLPRLMKSNCLDVGSSTNSPKHGGTFVYAQCDWGGPAGQNLETVFQCHNKGRENVTAGGGWNRLTGW